MCSKVLHRWLLFSLVLVLLPGLSFLWASSPVHLTILHTNDHHGRLIPFDTARQKSVGGMAARMTLIRQIRKEVAQNNGYLLLLDAGDVNTGEPLSDIFAAKPDIEIMNAMGYNAVGVGNHEFDLVFDKVKEQVELANFPFLSANSFYRKTNKLIYPPMIIWNIGDIKVGAFALTSSNTPQISTNGHNPRFFFSPEEEVLPHMLEYLKGKVDFIIAITHVSHFKMVDLANRFPGIDLVIGGHTHLEIYEPVKAGKTLLVEAGSYGKTIGRWDLTFQDKKMVDWKYRLLGINYKLPKNKSIPGNSILGLKPDPLIEEMLQPYREDTERILNESIGFARKNISRGKRSNLPKSSPLGNLITDAIRYAAKADIAIQNVGGIRSDLLKGDITYRDIRTIMPFANTIITYEATGGQLLDLLNFIARADPRDGIFSEVSGVSFRVKGERAIQVRVKGEPIKRDKTYRIATNSFLGRGGDGYYIFATFSEMIDTGLTIDKAIINYISKHSPLRPSREVRMQWLP